MKRKMALVSSVIEKGAGRPRKTSTIDDQRIVTLFSQYEYWKQRVAMYPRFWITSVEMCRNFVQMTSLILILPNWGELATPVSYIVNQGKIIENQDQ